MALFEDNNDDRTESPSLYRREEFRRQGSVAVSRELLSVGVLLAAGASLYFVASEMIPQFKLMAELTKIKAVAEKNVHDAPHEVLLVLDATTGQNALSQAKHFTKNAGLTGVGLTKLDCAPKGGMALAIADEFKLA